MVSVTIHYRGQASEQRRLPCLPPVGAYITSGGRLWVVDSITFAQSIDIYCIAVSEQHTSEVEYLWAGWADAPATPHVVGQPSLFPETAA